MNKRCLQVLSLLPLLLAPACESVRTVYDENGHVVKDSEPGKEKDLQSYFDENFASTFTEKKNKAGVTETTSNKVSRFQKDLDAARHSDKRFNTYAFGDTKGNDARSVQFNGADKASFADKRFDGSFASNIDMNLRPAFMREGKGISREDSAFAGMGPGDRSPLEGEASDMAGRSYGTRASDFSTADRSGYIESRRDRYGQPKIIDYRQYYKKTIEETRTMLGRDKATP